MRNFELWMVVAAERDVTAHFKPSHEIQQVKNYLQTETHDNRRTFFVDRETDRQTDKPTNPQTFEDFLKIRGWKIWVFCTTSWKIIFLVQWLFFLFNVRNLKFEAIPVGIKHRYHYFWPNFRFFWNFCGGSRETFLTDFEVSSAQNRLIFFLRNSKCDNFAST